MSGIHPSEAERLSRAEGEIAAIKETQDQILSDLHEIKNSLNSVGKANWPLVISAIGVVVAIILPSVGALALLISLQIKNEVSPLQAKADVSVRDRGELHESLVQLAQAVSDINSRERESTAVMRAASVELETQVRSNSQIANLYRASLQQTMAILWRDTKGYDMPKLDYYTDISLPKPQGQ